VSSLLHYDINDILYTCAVVYIRVYIGTGRPCTC